MADQGSTVIVGGTSGLGKHLAQVLAARGDDVFVTGRDKAKAQSVAAQVGGKASSVENQGGHAVAVSSAEGGAPTLTSLPAYRYVAGLIAVLGLVALILIFAPYFALHPAKTSGPAGLVGQAAPVFALYDDRGQPVSLARYRGRIAVMNLWASWCPPCRAEMPDLQRLSNLYAARGLAIIGVNEGESPSAARDFLLSVGVSAPALLDLDLSAGRANGVIGLPTTVFVRADGTIEGRYVGAIDQRVLASHLANLNAQ